MGAPLQNQTKWMAVGFLILAVAIGVGSYYSELYLQSLLLTLMGVCLSAALGLVIVNIFLDKKSRKIAAGPLMQLVGEPITRYHNDLFITPGRDKFGIPEFNRIADAYNKSSGNPQVLSQEERRMYAELIDEHIQPILDCINDLDLRLSDLMSVLGWSYNAQIIAAALTCKKNILGFKALSNPNDAAESLRRTEYYIDIDTSSAHVIVTLSNIYGKSIITNN